jgi:hypothetical protein
MPVSGVADIWGSDPNSTTRPGSARFAVCHWLCQCLELHTLWFEVLVRGNRLPHSGRHSRCRSTRWGTWESPGTGIASGTPLGAKLSRGCRLVVAVSRPNRRTIQCHWMLFCVPLATPVLGVAYIWVNTSDSATRPSPRRSKQGLGHPLKAESGACPVSTASGSAVNVSPACFPHLRPQLPVDRLHGGKELVEPSRPIVVVY